MTTRLPDTLDGADAYLTAAGWFYKLRAQPLKDGLPGEVQYTATVWRQLPGGYIGSRKCRSALAVTALEMALQDAEACLAAGIYADRPRRRKS